MEDAPSPPRGPSPGEALRAGFASFDAASFLKSQQEERERRAAQLLAAANAMSSSDEEDSSDSESDEQREPAKLSGTKKRRHRSAEEKEEKRRKKKRKKEKHSKKSSKQRDLEKAALEFEQQIAAEFAAGEQARRSSMPAWMSAAGAPIAPLRSTLQPQQQTTDYYADTRPDPANIAFGKLYRGDVASYRRYDPTGYIAALLRSGKARKSGNEEPARMWGSGGAPVRAKRRHGKLKMWTRPGNGGGGGLSGRRETWTAEYLALDSSKDGEQQQSGHEKVNTNQATASTAAAQVGLTIEEYLLDKTREFNAKTREHPENLQLWLDFADFQQQAMEMTGGQRQRGAARACAEKQIAILEKALQYHPGSEKLFLQLLKAAEKICDAEELDRRWRRVLAYCPGSAVLWKAYIARKSTQFASFQASEVASVYPQALAALKQERERLKRTNTPSQALSGCEQVLVEIALAAAAFRLQTGYTELGVAAVRALLEFNWFSPEGWPEDALEVMFEEFWRGQGKVIGDLGAKGWGTEMENEAEDAKNDDDEEEQPGGWVEVPKDTTILTAAAGATAASAWAELGPAIQARFGHALKPAELPGDAVEELEEEEEEESEQQDETEEALLARLGMDLEAALADAEQELTPDVLSSWLELEQQRDAAQWEAAVASQEHKDNEAEDEENVLKFVEWEDISGHLCMVTDPVAKDMLLQGCLQLLGVQLGESSGTTSMQNSADEIAVAVSWLGIGGPSFQSEDSSAGQAADWAWLCDSKALQSALRGQRWWALTTERQAFVLRCLEMLISGPLKHDSRICRAHMDIAAWSISADKVDKLQRDWAAGKAASKQLLAAHRDNLTLWAAFAELEAASGRVKAARKVYNASLSGVNLSSSSQIKLPGLVQLALGWAQLELGCTSTTGAVEKTPIPLDALLRASPDALQSALRPLLWLGSSGAISLTQEPSRPCSAQDDIVLARKGYQDALLRMLRSRVLTEAEVGMVTAAAAVELIVAAMRDAKNGVASGVMAALALYKQVLDGCSSETVEIRSAVVQQLTLERCALAVDAAIHAVHAVHAVPPAVANAHLVKALGQLPGSPPLLRMLRKLQVSSHAMTALRRQLNSLLDNAPCVSIWLVLIGIEIGTKAPRSAVRAAFQRAISHPSGQHSPLLWRLYLCFEGAFGSTEAVHRVYLRAVEACPWSKALWIDGLELLNGHVAPRQLSEFLNTIKEKDLALRTDVLEAVLVQMDTAS